MHSTNVLYVGPPRRRSEIPTAPRPLLHRSTSFRGRWRAHASSTMGSQAHPRRVRVCVGVPARPQEPAAADGGTPGDVVVTPSGKEIGRVSNVYLALGSLPAIAVSPADAATAEEILLFSAGEVRRRREGLAVRMNHSESQLPKRGRR